MLGRCQWCGVANQLRGVRWSLNRLTEKQLQKFQKKHGDSNWLCKLCYEAALDAIHTMRSEATNAVPDNH